MTKAVIGIDAGVNTGIAYRNSKGSVQLLSLPIHKAMEWVGEINSTEELAIVIVEDARKRKWFGKNSYAKAQGAGSIKRDCKIWDDFLKDLGVNYRMVHPLKGGTKWDAERFKRTFKIMQRTNEHTRDAYLLIAGIKIK